MLRRTFIAGATFAPTVLAAGAAARATAGAPPLPLPPSYVTGTAYSDAPGVVTALQVGERLELRRAPSNPYDPHTIEVWARGAKLGHIPGTDARFLAACMDAGDTVCATVRRAAAGPGRPDIRLDLSIRRSGA